MERLDIHKLALPESTISHFVPLIRPYLFEKLLLGFILQQNQSVDRQKKKEKLNKIEKLN